MKALHLLTILSLHAVSLADVRSANEPQKTPSDAAIREKVVGTWIVDLQSHNGFSIKGTATIVSENKFISTVTVTTGDRREEMGYEGRWDVKDGFLIETITKSDSRMAPVGMVTRDKVIRVNDQELVYLTEEGKTVTRKRKK